MEYMYTKVVKRNGPVHQKRRLKNGYIYYGTYKNIYVEIYGDL